MMAHQGRKALLLIGEALFVVSAALTIAADMRVARDTTRAVLAGAALSTMILSLMATSISSAARWIRVLAAVGAVLLLVAIAVAMGGH